MSRLENLPKRKHPRLKKFDYGQSGAYFLTVCTYGRICCLSTIDNAVGRGLAPAAPQLTAVGKLAEEELLSLAVRFPKLSIEKYVLMPNHVHILLLLEGTGAAAGASPRPTGAAGVTDVIRVWKSQTTRRKNELEGTPGRPLWQSSFHDHVIRDEYDLLNHWNYMDQNPARWAEDKYFIK